MKWFAVRSLFRLDVRGTPRPGVSVVEERVVLIRAEGLDAALSAGEDEARAYAGGNRWPNEDGERVVGRYLEACDAFALAGAPRSGTEAYSKVLYINRAASDKGLIKRFFGAQSEETSKEGFRFEPDFERLAKMPGKRSGK